MPAFRYLILPTLALSLSSCDSVKSKALAIIDKKIEETSADPGSADAGAASGIPQEAVRQVTAKDYHAFTSLTGHVVVVDFYADWCGPCKRLAPVLEGIANSSNGKVLLGKVDVEKDGELGHKQGVSNIPDIRIFVGGKQVDRMVGPSPEEVRKKIQSHARNIAAPAKPKPEQPKPEQPASDKPADPAKPGGKPADPEQPKEDPTIKPMDKEWLPPGLQRKNT